MKRIFIMVLISTFIKSYSQELPAFRSLRYDEDYSSIKNDTSANWYNKMKFSPLSKKNKSYISYGGDIRFQYFYVKNEGWGDAPEDNDGYTLTRFLTHADLHLGEHFRSFIEMQSSLANSRIDPSPVDDNPLEIHQAFVDYHANLANTASLTFRLGRQEFLYGSERLISVKQGPNNRQSFDAIRSLLIAGNYKVDFFYSHSVAPKMGIFDDGFNKNTKFWGAYLVRNKLPVLENLDIYYLGLWKRETAFDDGQGKELRHSIGSRIWSNKKDWKYDIEGLYQFGEFAGKTIVAWTASINTSYTFSKAKLKPEVGLKTGLISGDKQYDDDMLQTFNPLFPRGAFFGLAALMGPANLMDIHPYLSLSISQKLDFGLDCDIFWRYSRNDGLYGISGALTYSGRNTTSKYIGNQLAFNLTYSPNNFLSFTGEFTWFNAQGFLKEAGSGKDILFTAFTAELKF